MRRTRNALTRQRVRGFKSHPLRFTRVLANYSLVPLVELVEQLVELVELINSYRLNNIYL